ncbi:hypothetical protein T492DRAFT_981816 [Pavlovales sp. CCMP2436]|nr:hypothetical protein T492DRAFT_981816 [Pavlovales sp. CCMP2436]
MSRRCTLSPPHMHTGYQSISRKSGEPTYMLARARPSQACSAGVLPRRTQISPRAWRSRSNGNHGFGK